MTDGARDSTGPDQPGQEWLAVCRQLVRNHYKAVPVDPESGKPDVSSTNEFLKRLRTDRELVEMSKRNPRGVGMLLDSNVHCLAIDTDDREALFAIYSVFRHDLKRAPAVIGKGRFSILFRSSEPIASWTVERSKVGEGKVRQPVRLLGRGRTVVLPPTIDPDTGKPFEWHDGNCTALGVRATDLPELTMDMVGKLLDGLERYGFRQVVRKSSLPDGGLFDLERAALKRVDEWFPKLGLPQTRQVESGRWSGEARLGPNSEDSPTRRSRIGLTVSQYEIRDSEGREHDALALVAAARLRSGVDAAAWLRYILGIGPNHERLRVHMEEIGLKARYNTRLRRQEFRRVSPEGTWQAGSDRLFAWVQSNIPGRVIGREPLKRAFDAILYDREVDPVREYLDARPLADDSPQRLDLMITKVVVARCRLDYAEAVIRSFLLSILYMACRPGHVQTDMPILIGSREGLSTLLEGLCPDPRLYTDAIRFGATGRKLADSLHGRMIAMLPVTKKSLGRTAFREVQAVLGHHTDQARVSGAVWPEDRPRLCGLIGFADDFGSLYEEIKTGRNFWPVQLDFGMLPAAIRDWTREHRDLLWAQIKIDYLAGRSPSDLLLNFINVRYFLVERYLKGARPIEGLIDRFIRTNGRGHEFTMEEMFLQCALENSKSNQALAANYLRHVLKFSPSVQRQYEGRLQKVWKIDGPT